MEVPDHNGIGYLRGPQGETYRSRGQLQRHHTIQTCDDAYVSEMSLLRSVVPSSLDQSSSFPTPVPSPIHDSSIVSTTTHSNRSEESITLESVLSHPSNLVINLVKEMTSLSHTTV